MARGVQSVKESDFDSNKIKTDAVECSAGDEKVNGIIEL